MGEAPDLERLEQTRSALADDRLLLHAQPIIDLRDSGIVGLELLVRLRDQEGRIVPPGDFLPVAEGSTNGSRSGPSSGRPPAPRSRSTCRRPRSATRRCWKRSAPRWSAPGPT